MTSSVIPMKLVPKDYVGTQATQESSLHLPVLTSSHVSINKQNNVGDLSNLDSELLEILHNNDLTEDAKAKLYWVALHKAEIYKDKSMWTEPVIVEMRENRFIPIPIIKTETSNVLPKAVIRKRNIDEVLPSTDDLEIQSNKRPKSNEPAVSNSNVGVVDSQPQSVVRESILGKKRKRDSSEVENSNNELKRMALVNRIQHGSIAPETLASNVSISEPLVVYGEQNQEESRPSTSTDITHSVRPIATVSNKFKQNWLDLFLESIKDLPVITQHRIKDLILEVIEKDPSFKITKKSLQIAQNIEILTNPKTLLSRFVDKVHRPTRQSIAFKKYLERLGIDIDQYGSGLKTKNIKRWVQL
jgi:hypothetical protein